MATPRVKRAFAGAASDPAQRQITSFFDRDRDSDSAATTDRPALDRRSLTPLLPPSVQANLLAVGMRVRKSVPEGYKTGKEEEETASAPRPRPTTTATASFVSSYHAYNAGQQPARPSVAQRELTPFCGLHKIGGLGVQSFGDDDGRPLFAASLFHGDGAVDADDADDAEPPSLTSSQETVSSVSSSAAAYASQPRFASQTSRFGSSLSSFSTRKRFYGQEEEEDDGEVDDGAGAVDHPAGRSFQVHEDARLPVAAAPWQAAQPFYSTSVSGWLTSGNAGRRVLAVPRRRQKHGEQLYQHRQQLQQLQQQPAVKQADGSLLFLDQENVDVMGDFGEADFLDASMLAPGGDDMEMGGM